MNFITINDSSTKLINQKIESNLSFFEKMTHIPISIYDLASLDDLVKDTTSLDYINSIVILDTQNRVLSKSYNFQQITQKELLKIQDNKSIVEDNTTYEIRYKKLKNNDAILGSFYMIFDTSENSQFRHENKKNTAYIILFEILISTLLSYIIGNRLTKALTKLSKVAEDIGDNKHTKIPYQHRKDEFGILAQSMHQMQIDLKQRNKRLKDFTKDLSKQKKELISANKAKDDFLANMSHELKTPLNSINVISSIMMKNTQNSLNQDQVKNLSIINNCGNDLLFLINDVLDVSKLEAGKIQLINETINFKQIMNNIYDMFKPQMNQKNINFIYEYDDDVSYIYSDEQRIKQVVKNLLSNAVKFAAEETVKLSIKNLHDMVQVTVEDNGIGIAEDKLEYIFDRFKQVDESITRTYGGTGLGLAICKELTHLLGGEIKVTSQEKKGTTFIVTIRKNTHQIDEKALLSVKLNLQKQNNDNNLFKSDELLKKTLHQKENTFIILNNDPISFFKLVIELQKDFDILQSNNTKNFLDEYKKNTYIKLAIIDTSCIEKDDLEKIITKLPLQFILIYSLKLDIFDNYKIVSKIKKPFTPKTIIETLKKTRTSNEQI
jgi:signal transduction histidine kinase